MHHNFVINTHSFPLNPAPKGYSAFLDTVKGMLASGKGSETIRIYMDCTSNRSFLKLEISNSYNVTDFINDLIANSEHDLAAALAEIEDKSPALDHIADDIIEEIAESSFYFCGDGYSGSIDFLAISWFLDATLISLASSARWTSPEIEFCTFPEPTDHKPISIKNISSHQQGMNISDAREELLKFPELESRFPPSKFTNEFSIWLKSIDVADRIKVYEKLSLAHKRDYQGGTPLFDTLNNAEGMREIRLRAHAGGAIRLLFGHLEEEKYAILWGFIKKDDNEGYDAAIKAALPLWKALKPKDQRK